MDLYSAVCAVQNLWLAARAENLGVGWVSILDYDALRAALGIPAEIQPIAYLCVGSVTHFFAQPELEAAGWLPRLEAARPCLVRRLAPAPRRREAARRAGLTQFPANVGTGFAIRKLR